ncbi:MAG TPA: hypothetical protein PK231_04705 [Acidocella sp.]|nr:hypothetical protein [Acidocella sp.]
MTRRPVKRLGFGRKARDDMGDINPADMLEAFDRVFTAAFQTISEGFRHAILSARAAMPEGATDEEKNAVSRAVITTFGCMIRNVWLLCGAEAIVGDETRAGKLVRLTIAQSILKAYGVEIPLSDDEMDRLCDTTTKN